MGEKGKQGKRKNIKKKISNQNILSPPIYFCSPIFIRISLSKWKSQIEDI